MIRQSIPLNEHIIAKETLCWLQSRIRVISFYLTLLELMATGDRVGRERDGGRG